MPATLSTEWAQDNLIDTTFVRATALPRLTLLPQASTKRYEVLVTGAGPCGLMLTTVLARYGLSSTSVLCVDSRPQQTLIGNADGTNGRTLEILAQLGLESKIRRHGTPFAESTMWVRPDGNPDALVKIMTFPFQLAPSRYEEVTGLHQGHIERIFRDDLVLHGGSDVQYGSKLAGMRMDEDGDREYPVLATIEKNGIKEEVRTKYLIGADGARSAVRNFMGVEIEGNTTQELWGVMDLVIDSDFPDARRQTNINTGSGMGDQAIEGVKGGFIVPRERLSSGDYLTRLYLDMTVDDEHEEGSTEISSAEDQRQKTKEKRSQITEALILDRAAKLFHPYRFQVKKGTQVHWWAAFPISQTLAKTFTLKDSTSHPRVIIAGDACHSHSPRQGQGMNVSIQDSYNMAWKLAYTILGLSASDEDPKLLNSYEEERLPNARNLISFDRAMNQENRSMEQKMGLMKQFATSCGVEYEEGLCVSKADFREGHTWDAVDYLNGVIRPGRRLLNSRYKRFADGNMRDMHDELGGAGRFSIVMFASDDFGIKDSMSTKIADEICSKVVKIFPAGLVQTIILQPNLEAQVCMDGSHCVRKGGS